MVRFMIYETICTNDINEHTFLYLVNFLHDWIS
jgi:hypothetical protein